MTSENEPRGGGEDRVRKRIFLSTRWELAPVKNPIQAAADLPPGAVVSMGCFASSSGFGVTIDLARGLIAKGHQVTPHLPVRSISGPAHLTDLLQSLQEADIRDVFVVAGNTHKAVGPYPPTHLRVRFRVRVHPEMRCLAIITVVTRSDRRR